MKRLMVVLAVVVVSMVSLSASTVMAQEICYADCDGDLRVNLDDLVIMKTEYFRDNCEASGSVAELEARITALETQLAQLTALLANVTRGTVQGQDTIRFSNMNVQIVNGSGATNGPVNGRGNLIVGYNELRGLPYVDDRSGSHNIVVGTFNNYSSFGGLVAGSENTISGQCASVSGGVYNTASGNYSGVSGGAYNTASGDVSSVSGGEQNTAGGTSASVSGGNSNTASGYYSSVSGGASNMASGLNTSVSGGVNNTASGQYSVVSGGDHNTASGYWTSISGGSGNTASNYASSVSGGRSNQAMGAFSFVGGGGNENPVYGNYAVADYSAILGGTNNTAGDPARTDSSIGGYSSISGGRDNNASGGYSSVSGGRLGIVEGDDDWRAGSLFEDE